MLFKIFLIDDIHLILIILKNVVTTPRADHRWPPWQSTCYSV